MPENGAVTSSEGNSYNPFARRTEFSSQSILMYKITTFLSYVILIVTTMYYTFNKPRDAQEPHHTIWGNNKPSPFAQNSIVTSVYWLILFALQLLSHSALYSSNTLYSHAAATLAPHHIASNLLLFGFLNLWVRSHFWLGLLLLVINFFNLTFAYFRYSTSPRLIHIGVVAGPLAWNFVALYWVGALAFGARHLAARIVANVFIWGILAYGSFFLVVFKDYTMGVCLSVLAFSTGVGQFLTKIPVLQLQWIFAFTIGALLFLMSVAVAAGKSPVPRGVVVDEERERAPLLADE